MPADKKILIRALVDKFTGLRDAQGRVIPWRADWIENKGEGQIFLLHGSPGVGKTFTAGESEGTQVNVTCFEGIT
jgi:ATP-dependent Lon protease